MKPRHAAALALVGWYLIIPPAQSDKRVNTTAPLSEWDIVSRYTFKTASECEKVRAQVIALAAKIESGAPEFAVKDKNQREAYVTAFRMVLCISGDDPRLKEK